MGRLGGRDQELKRPYGDGTCVLNVVALHSLVAQGLSDGRAACEPTADDVCATRLRNMANSMLAGASNALPRL